MNTVQTKFGILYFIVATKGFLYLYPVLWFSVNLNQNYKKNIYGCCSYKQNISYFVMIL